MDLKAIKERIRKCLALGEDDRTLDTEADNALAFARRLMLQHNISEDDVRKLTPHEASADAEYGTDCAYSEGTNLSGWETSLAYLVARLVGTVKWYRETGCAKQSAAGTLEYDEDGRPKQANRITFYGPLEDVADAVGIFDEWRVTIAALARMRYGGALRGSGRSYALGFTAALSKKVSNIVAAEQAKLAQATDQVFLVGATREQLEGTALVVREATAVMAAKLKRCDEWLQREKGITLRTSGGSRGSGDIDCGAFSAGLTDGARTDFSRKERRKQLP